MVKVVRNDRVERIKTRRERREMGGLFIPAGLFLGMGLGFVIDKLVGGLFIGLGTGFLLFALTNILKKKN
jgi:hypothetical protein